MGKHYFPADGAIGLGNTKYYNNNNLNKYLKLLINVLLIIKIIKKLFRIRRKWKHFWLEFQFPKNNFITIKRKWWKGIVFNFYKL